MANCLLTSNKANDHGGAIFNDQGTLAIKYSLITGNQSGNTGGALANKGGTLTLQNSQLSLNRSEFGGGINNSSDGELVIKESMLSGNEATFTGGGIFSWAELTVTGSTFYANQATENAGGIHNQGPARISNSTFTANLAKGGSGIFNSSGDPASGDLTLENSTFYGNKNVNWGVIYNNGDLTIANTIIANSIKGDCFNNVGTIISNTHNIIETQEEGNPNSCFSPTNISEAPLLSELADNGGPTKTHALQPSSPAINAGDADTCANPNVNERDQRGVPRPQGTGCDIGAFEVADSTAAFSAAPRSGERPLTVQFTDSSTWFINSWEWDFGDGGTSTAQNPAHTYTTPGSYTVSLTVNGPGGSDSITREDFIQVSGLFKQFLPLVLR